MLGVWDSASDNARGANGHWTLVKPREAPVIKKIALHKMQIFEPGAGLIQIRWKNCISWGRVSADFGAAHASSKSQVGTRNDGR